MCDWTPYFDWLWIRRWRFTSFNGRTTTGLKYSPKASGAFSKVKIKIISNDVITLSYVKANILGGLIFYRIILEQTLVSRVQVSLIRKVTCTASYVLWAVVILKYLLYLSAGLSWLFRIEIGSLLPFLLNWLNLHCCTCQTDTAVLTKRWHRLTQNGLADWRRTHEFGNTNKNLKMTLTAAAQWTNCSNSCCSHASTNGRTTATTSAI